MGIFLSLRAGSVGSTGNGLAVVTVVTVTTVVMIVPLTGGPPVVTYTQYKMKQCNMKQYSVSL